MGRDTAPSFHEIGFFEGVNLNVEMRRERTISGNTSRSLVFYRASELVSTEWMVVGVDLLISICENLKPLLEFGRGQQLYC